MLQEEGFINCRVCCPTFFWIFSVMGDSMIASDPGPLEPMDQVIINSQITC
jgi:hypothetical protein